MSTSPLVEAEVDLTDFPFMPIMVAQLRQSKAWLICKRKPQLAFYMLNLWMASWHGRPAASVENDDMVLADIAGCDEKTWAKVKADVLRGWVPCSDGRIYHPVVAERAKEAWSRKLARRSQTEAARLAREAEKLRKLEAARAEVDALTRRTSPATDPVTVPVTDIVTEPVTASKREGKEGEGEGEGKKLSLSAAAGGSGGRDDAYRRFTNAHPRGLDEPDAVRRELGKRLDQGVLIEEIVAGAERYAVECRGRDRQYTGAPAKWLADGKWRDGKPKPEVALPVVARGTPQGEAWAEHLGPKAIWADGKRTVPAEWPPGREPSHTEAAA